MTRRTVTVELTEKLSLVVGYSLVKAEPEVGIQAGWGDTELIGVNVGRDYFAPDRGIAVGPHPIFDSLFMRHMDEIHAAIERDVTDMDPAMDPSDVDV